MRWGLLAIAAGLAAAVVIARHDRDPSTAHLLLPTRGQLVVEGLLVGATIGCGLGFLGSLLGLGS